MVQFKPVQALAAAAALLAASTSAAELRTLQDVAEAMARPVCVLDGTSILTCPGQCSCPEGLFCDPTSGLCNHSPRAEGEPCGPQEGAQQSFDCDQSKFPTLQCRYSKEDTKNGLGPWVPNGATCEERTTICDYDPPNNEIAALEGRRKRYEDAIAAFNPEALLNTLGTAQYNRNRRVTADVMPKVADFLDEADDILGEIQEILNNYTPDTETQCPWLKTSFRTLRMHILAYKTRIHAATDPYVNCDRNDEVFQEAESKFGALKEELNSYTTMDNGRDKYVKLDDLFDELTRDMRRIRENRMTCALLIRSYATLRSETAKARKQVARFRG